MTSTTDDERLRVEGDLALWRWRWRIWSQLDRRTKRLLLAWGAVLAVMNSCFYLAIDRLPLGTVASDRVPAGDRPGRRRCPHTAQRPGIVTRCRWRVPLLTDVRLILEPIGFAFAAANALLFALYIVLGHRVATSDQLEGLRSKLPS